MNAQEIIRLLQLQPLPIEGGYYRETWRADEFYAIPHGQRALGTAIYYLLTSEPECFSSVHRLAGDEIYHYYLGDPAEILLLYPDGHSRRVTLGPDLLRGQAVQFVVPRGIWQGARLAEGGQFALLGTTMSPGFDPADFELGSRVELLQQHPAQSELISQLTR